MSRCWPPSPQSFSKGLRQPCDQSWGAPSRDSPTKEGMGLETESDHSVNDLVDGACVMSVTPKLGGTIPTSCDTHGRAITHLRPSGPSWTSPCCILSLVLLSPFAILMLRSQHSMFLRSVSHPGAISLREAVGTPHCSWRRMSWADTGPEGHVPASFSHECQGSGGPVPDWGRSEMAPG